MDERTLDQDAERLFLRNGASVHPELETLTRFVADLRDAYAAPPDAATRAAHIHALVETCRSLPQPAVAGNGFKPARRRRGIAVRGGIVAAALVLAGGSAMAATGALPDAAQDAVSRVAKRIGVSIPRSDKAVAVRRSTVEHREEQARTTRSTKVTKSKPDAPKIEVDSDDDTDSSDDGVATTTTSRRPRNNRPTQPTVPTEPEPDADDSDSDLGAPSDGGGSGGRGDSSGDGDGDGSANPQEPPDDDDGDGGRGNPIDGSPSGADDEPADGDGDGGGAGGGGRP